jgi:hypothetical protein
VDAGSQQNLARWRGDRHSRRRKCAIRQQDDASHQCRGLNTKWHRFFRRVGHSKLRHRRARPGHERGVSNCGHSKPHVRFRLQCRQRWCLRNGVDLRFHQGLVLSPWLNSWRRRFRQPESQRRMGSSEFYFPGQLQHGRAFSESPNHFRHHILRTMGWNRLDHFFLRFSRSYLRRLCYQQSERLRGRLLGHQHAPSFPAVQQFDPAWQNAPQNGRFRDAIPFDIVLPLFRLFVLLLSRALVECSIPAWDSTVI